MNLKLEAKKVVLSGSETVFSVFNQTQVSLNTLRLTIDGRPTQQTGDITSQLDSIRREFQIKGDSRWAIQEVQRCAVTFAQRIQEWERGAQSRERNTIGMAGNALKKMRDEHNRVRREASMVARYFTKLEVDLNQIFGQNAASQSPLVPSHNFSEQPDHQPESEDSDARSSIHDQSTVDETNTISTAVAYDNIQASLDKVLGKPMPISYASATRKITVESGSREQAWDLDTDLIVVVRWVPHEAIPLTTTNLFVWLVPKAELTSVRLVEIIDDFWLQLSSDRYQYRFPMDRCEPFGIAEPQNKQIAAFIRETRKNSFLENSDSQYSCFRAFVTLVEPLETQFFLQWVRR